MINKILTESYNINEKNHLCINNVDLVDIAQEYGTPTIVYDKNGIINKIRKYKTALEKENINYNIAYASKAFSCKAIYRIARDEDISIDIVSIGELYTALEAEFPPEKIHFHGNNKLPHELQYAIENKVGTIIVDNFYEIELLNDIIDIDSVQDIILRISPGISVYEDEIEYEGQRDKKFGFDIESGQLDRAVETVLKNNKFNLLGFHSHFGSQAFQTNAYEYVINKMMSKAKEFNDKYDFTTKVINVGGSYAISYTESDSPLETKTYISDIVGYLKNYAEKYDLKCPELWIEPGRSIVGDASVTLYTTGSKKIIPGIANYISIDGGMSDNIRPSLYDSKYTAILADEVITENTTHYRVAGRCCESDILIKDAFLPEIESPRILAVLSTGAYGYSMASNYNRHLKPLVLFIDKDNVEVAIERETLEHLVALDK